MSLLRRSWASGSCVVGVSTGIAPLWFVIRARNRSAGSARHGQIASATGYHSELDKSVSVWWHSGYSQVRKFGVSVTGQSPDLRGEPPATPISLVGPAPHSWRGSFP